MLTGDRDAVQAQLAKKAPPRKRPTNDALKAMLRGLLTDPHGRPMVPTYATKRSRRYSYYETRKDLARPADPPATRFAQGQLERHLVVHLTQLLEDEHALRRLSGIEEAGQLRTMFDTSRLLACRLAFESSRAAILQDLIAALQVRAERIEVVLNADALAVGTGNQINWTIALPDQKPFREAKLRIDAKTHDQTIKGDLLALLADAKAAQELVLAKPELSLHQLGKAENRCRTHLARLLRIAWLSPRIVEIIASGTQPDKLNRQVLLSSTIPLDWVEQERQFGLSG